MFKLFSRELLAPQDTVTETPAKGGNLSDTDDILKFLKEDVPADELDLGDKKDKEDKKEVKLDDKEDKTDKEDKKDDGDEVDELKSLEEDLEEPDEEKLELSTPVPRRAILKKYPELFKDFPFLETAYYREQAFTSIYPTIDDARDAKEKADTLDRFESDVLSGNTENLLKLVKDDNPKAFVKLVDNYMMTLQKIDNNAFLHVAGNVVKSAIGAAIGRARKTNNETLERAALIMNEFMFGDEDYQPPAKLSRDEDPKDNEKETNLRKREEEFNKRQFETARDTVGTKVNNTIRAAIDANIDPKESMTDYVKKQASREAFEKLTEVISRDERFRKIVDKLWESAAKQNYSQSALDKISDAFKSKARTVLKDILLQARNEALRGMNKRVRNENGSDKAQSEKKTSSSQKEGTEFKKGMSTLEFLQMD